MAIQWPVVRKLRGSGLSLAELKKHLGSTRRPNNVVSNRGLRLDIMGLTDWRSYGVTHADVRGFHFPVGYVPEGEDIWPLCEDHNLGNTNRLGLKKNSYTGLS